MLYFCILLIVLLKTTSGLSGDLYPFVNESVASPIVITTSGRFAGFTIRQTNVWVGIPYAAPPTGQLRWEKAQPYVLTTNEEITVRNATHYGPSCPQMNRQGLGTLDEDCLYLNIWAPRWPSSLSTGYPVMLWIHGGAFIEGSGTQIIYDGLSWTNAAIQENNSFILVSINYRLNVLGYFAQMSLLDENGQTIANQGITDQRMALKWIQNNIAQFGGDRNSITIMGESAGSMSACLHLISPLSANLFHSIIMNSGPCDTASSLRDTSFAHATTNELAMLVGCNMTSSIQQLTCLRSIDSTILVATVANVSIPKSSSLAFKDQDKIGGVFPFNPIVDGTEIPVHPLQAFLSDMAYQVPILIGANHDEFLLRILYEEYFHPPNSTDDYLTRILPLATFNNSEIQALYSLDKFDGNFTKAYVTLLSHKVFLCGARRMAGYMSKQSKYLYSYNHVPEFYWLTTPDLTIWPGAYHLAELFNLFQTLAASFYGDDIFEPDELPLAKTIRYYWTNMITKNQPNDNTSLVQWLPYLSDRDQSLMLDKNISMNTFIHMYPSCDLLSKVHVEVFGQYLGLNATCTVGNKCFIINTTPEEYDRTTSAPLHDSQTVIKYIMPRVIKPTPSKSCPGASRGSNWSNVSLDGLGTKAPQSLAALARTSYGLAACTPNPTFSTISPIHSINGERIIDEQRELSQVTETLSNAIINFCCLIAHTQIQELQIDWLQRHSSDNASVISKMYKTEMDSASRIIDETLRQRSGIDKKLDDTEKATQAHDTQYEQLLSKRNAFNRDVFDLERKIAQNNAEVQFLQRRIHSFEEETKFYLMRNQVLHDRRARARCDLDEEMFARNSLQMELQILESEKITKEDTHIQSLDDVRNSIDISQVAGVKQCKHYCDQLKGEVQRIRDEYEKKIGIFRAELHRNYECELYRYQVYKSTSFSTATRDHLVALEQHEHEKKLVAQQIATINGSISEILLKTKSIEKQIVSEREDRHINTRRQLGICNQLIQDRERDLGDVIRKRTALKQQIQLFKERLDHYPRKTGADVCNPRNSLQDIHSAMRSTGLYESRSLNRLSLPEGKFEPNYVSRSQVLTTAQPTTLSSRTKRSLMTRNEELWGEGTLAKFPDFNLDQDCDSMYRLLNISNPDEMGLVQILCNRSIEQRLEIRDKYRYLYGQSLGDSLEKIQDVNLCKVLRILLLTTVERDCYELRRILRQTTIDENILASIFFGHSSKHIQLVRESYQQLFRVSLDQDIMGDRDSPSKKVFLALLQSKRPQDDYINDDEIIQDIQALSNNEPAWKTEGSVFVRLLCNRSNTQLRQIFANYQRSGKVDIEQAVQLHTDGDLNRTLLAIVQILRNRSRFFAHELRKNLRTGMTNDDNLIYIIVSRCEIDMVQIKSEFQKLSKESLYDAIQLNTSGNYRRALLELLRHRIQVTSAGLRFEAMNQVTDRPVYKSTQPGVVKWKEPVISNSTVPLGRTALVRDSSNNSLDSRRLDDASRSENIHVATVTRVFDHGNQAKRHSLSSMVTKSGQKESVQSSSFTSTYRERDHHSGNLDDVD